MAGSVNCFLADDDVTGERNFEHGWRTRLAPHVLCSMDFAGSYTERGPSPVETLVARNF